MYRIIEMGRTESWKPFRPHAAIAASCAAPFNAK
jgi:hypothetical protein